ncbi:MAG: hypothetical protein JSS14_16015 [Proteobacteria bacterium]|nr:hypothetical protein [Pseudomonadota bacterium]
MPLVRSSLVAWLTLGHHFMRADQALLDTVLDWVRPTPASNIVIVAIDDPSVEAIGRPLAVAAVAACGTSAPHFDGQPTLHRAGSDP